MTTDTAVSLQGVSKLFRRTTDRRTTLKERIVRGRSRYVSDFWAVKDLTLDVPRGSVFGLIGHNGSGKSTTLKMIGRIYRPTEGVIKTRGRVAALIELGAGFHPDMTGRENIRLNGAILGLPRREIDAATDEIIEFSGLGDFIDDPVKHYSSGMYVRLGFSVAVHMKPDVLLVDEVLAVGDEEFQRRCYDHLYALRRSGRTIIVVSHGLGLLESLCDEIAWLEHGHLVESGAAPAVVKAYVQKVNEAEEASRKLSPTADTPSEDPTAVRRGSGELRVTRVDLVDDTGAPLGKAQAGQTLGLRLWYRTTEPVDDPVFWVGIRHESGLGLAGGNTRIDGIPTGTLSGRGYIDFLLPDCPLNAGRYRIDVGAADKWMSHTFDHWEDAFDLVVRQAPGPALPGVVALSASFSPPRAE